MSRADGRKPVRLFRGDTPHDVVCAALVAATLGPGRYVLAFSTDKTQADRATYLEGLRHVAGLHGWSDVVDISGLPLRAHLGGKRRGAWARTRDLIASLRILRERLAPVLGVEPHRLSDAVDELYVNCFHHPDVQALCRLFPGATLSYTPHGFDCLTAAEIHYYDPLCRPEARSRPGPLADAVKRLVWGDDAVPLRSVEVATAHSFNLTAPWAREQRSLAALLTREHMRAVFSRLPLAVRESLEARARQCAGEACLLLLSSADMGPAFPYDEELDGFVTLARHMTRVEGVRRVLVKPHPLNDDARVDLVLRHLETRAPELELVPILEHRHLPVEVLLAPFDIRACAGIGSSSARTLRRIYGLRSYCPEALLRRLYAYDDRLRRSIEVWIADNRPFYEAV